MTNYVDPTMEAFAAFRADDLPGPIHMLNLIRLSERAAYARESLPIFIRIGGSIVWRGRFEHTLIGPREERWDLCFVAQYPSLSAFLAMIGDPVYREAVKHRTTAVEDSRLIRVAPGAAGVGFA